MKDRDQNKELDDNHTERTLKSTVHLIGELKECITRMKQERALRDTHTIVLKLLQINNVIAKTNQPTKHWIEGKEPSQEGEHAQMGERRENTRKLENLPRKVLLLKEIKKKWQHPRGQQLSITW